MVIGGEFENLISSSGTDGVRDWTLHASPQPAYPSFRLIAALRLFHLALSTENSNPTDDVIDSWQDTLLGRRDVVSDENEVAWRATLRDICQAVGDRARRSIEKLDGVFKDGDSVGWSTWMKRNIWTLWREEQLVVAAVAASVADGKQF